MPSIQRKSALQNEKNDYIAKNKIDIGDFALHYHCNICKDTGTILKDGKSQKYSCFINRYNTLAYENTNMLELTKKINFDNFCLDIFDDKIIYGKYTQREFMRKIRDKSFSFIDNIDNSDEKSMIFYSPGGQGEARQGVRGQGGGGPAGLRPAEFRGAGTPEEAGGGGGARAGGP